MVDDRDATPQPGIRDARFGRRKFLVTAAVGVAAVGAAAGLAGCGGGGGSGSPQGSGGPTGAPKAGGMLRLGAQGGASTDTLDGQNGLTNTDFNRIYQLFDQLVVLDAKGQPTVVVGQVDHPEHRWHGVDDHDPRWGDHASGQAVHR